ncbi:hypothetical protein [Streptomyces sp. NPDC015125]|uniref:hypothetical protein n=1 Tax=Streptomyces sp. NPDC015125 TaxID=3364938 RepID=UPI00370318E3
MQRSLARKIDRAVNKTWSADPNSWRAGMVGALLIFPDGAFADAPTWHPGPGFEPCTGYSWLRSNGDGTATAVVGGVGPKERPAFDGGVWTEAEVWTVTADEELLLEVSSLWDKPHRITWMLDEEGAEIHREPYANHPLAAVDAYWDRFERTWGFSPFTLEDGSNPLGDGRRWLLLTAEPGWGNIPDEVDLLRVSSALADIFGAKVRVYSYNRARRDVNGPIRRQGVHGPLAMKPIISALKCLGRL